MVPQAQAVVAPDDGCAAGGAAGRNSWPASWVFEAQFTAWLEPVWTNGSGCEGAGSWCMGCGGGIIESRTLRGRLEGTLETFQPLGSPYPRSMHGCEMRLRSTWKEGTLSSLKSVRDFWVSTLPIKPDEKKTPCSLPCLQLTNVTRRVYANLFMFQVMHLSGRLEGRSYQLASLNPDKDTQFLAMYVLTF